MSPPTVVDRFRDSLDHESDAVALRFIEGAESTRELTYRQLHTLVSRAAAGLESLGLERGDRLVMAVATSPETFATYLASLVTGVVPLFLPEARADAPGEPQAERVAAMASTLGARGVLLPSSVASSYSARLGERAVAEERLWIGDASPGELRLEADPDAIAHLQPTSGSTGRPKVAVLRHRQLSANVRAIGEAIEERPGDQVVSWLPLYHDMGLVCLSCVLDWQRPLVLADPSRFVRHPIGGWLKLISRFGGTISPAPTSAYQVCARLARRVRSGSLDLSSWRVGFCGAEPVHASVLEGFYRAFAPHGLRPTTLLPVYGLAECTLAATIPPVGRSYHVERIDRLALAEGEAAAIDGGSGEGVDMVSVGAPLAGHELRIVDEGGEILGERRVGEIELWGPSTIDGYWREPARPPGDFLATGDLGYVADGHLFVTGRRKEIIICYGRNLLPSQIEAVVAGVLDDPLHQGVAAFGLRNAETGSEDLHVMIEHRQRRVEDRESRRGLEAQEEKVREAVLRVFEVGGTHVHWVEKGAIPKTTSGKIMRYRCRDMVSEGHATSRVAGRVAGAGR